MKHEQGQFTKVGKCLYRYEPNDMIYGRWKRGDKEFFQSLETTDIHAAQVALAARRSNDNGFHWAAFAQSGVPPALAQMLTQLLANTPALAQLLANTNTNTPALSLTLDELMIRYSRSFIHQKPKTVRRKNDILRRIRSFWPTPLSVLVADVKPSDVDTWLSTLQSRYSFGAPSRNLCISLVKEMFESPLRDGVIARNPAALIKSSKRSTPKRLTPTYEQFQAIIASVRNQQWNADAENSGDFLEAQGLLGLGAAELIPMTRADVDLEAGRIIAFRHKTSTGFAIPIFPQARPLIEKLCACCKNGDRLFKIKDGKHALQGACDRLGFPRFSQRSLRRMFITRAIEKGINVKVIAQWQAHKDGGKLILNTYSHVADAHSAEMAQRMA